MKSFITRQECLGIQTKLMEEIKEIKEKLEKVEINIAGLPQALLDKMDTRYVSKDRFRIIERVVYGLAGAILLAFLYAIMEGVFK